MRKVRNEKLVKPIYFTQFPRDLDNLQSVKLKKETFIKIVLPLIVAENEKILDDREKLKLLMKKKFTSDLEKQWLRQKLLEYKVKKGNLDELIQRMDMIPVSIALAQAAKERAFEEQQRLGFVGQQLTGIIGGYPAAQRFETTATPPPSPLSQILGVGATAAGIGGQLFGPGGIFPR